MFRNSDFKLSRFYRTVAPILNNYLSTYLLIVTSKLNPVQDILARI